MPCAGLSVSPVCVRIGVRCRFGGSRGRRRWLGWFGRLVLRRRICQRRIGADGIDDAELAGAERLLDAGHAGAAHRGVGRRDRSVDIRQDRLNMTECGAGILPRIDLGQQTVLQDSEIVGLGRGTAECVAVFDRRSPATASHRWRSCRGRADQARSRSRAHGWSAAFRRVASRRAAKSERPAGSWPHRPADRDRRREDIPCQRNPPSFVPCYSLKFMMYGHNRPPGGGMLRKRRIV